MDPIEIISKYYTPGSKLFDILVNHGRQVAKKAIDAADRVPDLKPDRNFIKEAAMLHDIGIFLTASPKIGCIGKHPYVSHGYLGRELLEKIGMPKHGLVCERHVGLGITKEDIILHNLPLPERDMCPVSIEEQIICYADKFFSKTGKLNPREKPVKKVLKRLEKYGHGKVLRFQSWVELFNGLANDD
ncbi:MAG: HDIG domain-containing protein [Thermodesulfobacteriota bacterium]|nr:HDIG domain-containing protein [Thermodesulfobacteriota bacterium]